MSRAFSIGSTNEGPYEGPNLGFNIRRMDLSTLIFYDPSLHQLMGAQLIDWTNNKENQKNKDTLQDPSRTKTKYNDPLIGIRLLSFFLKDFWDHAHDGYLGSNPYTRMVMEITSYPNKPDDKATYDTLVELGLRYRSYLLRVCELQYYLPRYSKCADKPLVRSNTGGRPTPSRHVSRPSFDIIKGRILEELGNVPQTKPNVRKQVCFLGIYVRHQFIFFRHCCAMDTNVPSMESMIRSPASILMRLTQPPRP